MIDSHRLKTIATYGLLPLVVACTASGSIGDLAPDNTHDASVKDATAGDALWDTSNGEDSADTDSSSEDAGIEDDAALDEAGNDASSDAGKDAGNADCGDPPALHPSDGGKLFCPFGPEAGAPIYCTPATQHCCLSPRIDGGFPPSTCPLNASACPYAAIDGGSDMQCTDPHDCAARGTGTTCCMNGPAPAAVPGCNYEIERGMNGTFCRNSCTGGEFVVCTSTSQCPSGKTCSLIKAKGYELGYCK